MKPIYQETNINTIQKRKGLDQNHINLIASIYVIHEEPWMLIS
jgi:hypothetical protein